MKTNLALPVIAGFAAVAALTIAAPSASASIICNKDHVCWHTQDKYDYPPAIGVHVYGDDWKAPNKQYSWKEHDGRGYWKGGVWVTF